MAAALAVLTVSSLGSLGTMSAVAQGGGVAMMGFSETGAAAERALEERFDTLLSADDIGGWIERLSARPHHVGSPYGRENAEYMAELLSSWGWDAAVETYWDR